MAARRGRVMIVDDDPLAARVVSRVLSREHDIVDVRSGADAMARLSAGEEYDLVLCDLIMPEMTGMELHERVQSAGLAVAERMVFMTGGAYTERAREFAERIRDRLLEKPFESEQLRKLARGFVAENDPDRG